MSRKISLICDSSVHKLRIHTNSGVRRIEMEIEDKINESMFEFAHVIGGLLRRGWTLGEVKYGERRLGLGPKMKISKDGTDIDCFSYLEVEAVLNRELEEEWRKK